MFFLAILVISNYVNWLVFSSIHIIYIYAIVFPYIGLESWSQMFFLSIGLREILRGNMFPRENNPLKPHNGRFRQFSPIINPFQSQKVYIYIYILYIYIYIYVTYMFS